MNTLISVRTNIWYAKKKDEAGSEEYKRYQELIFLVDQPAYRLSNDGDIIRERQIVEQRFVVSESNFDTLLGLLKGMKESEPEELH